MMATSGQTLNDRINAARYALAGQGLARCVCKATTEEVIGPKKKHLDYLLACTHEPNVSIPQLANLLIERTNHIYWVVVFKALVTVHHLMSYGNERFIQYLASSNYSFELSTFLDKTSARDFSMSTFIRRYSRYINEKALSYRLLACDLCKVKRGNEGVLRTMPIDRLLKTLPVLQNQLDALLEFDCGANDLNNGVINAAFMLLFRDLIGLFACHNDGIINLLNKYFNLNKKMCREAFDLYKKFLVRMDKVSEFLRVAEAVGIDKDEIPDLRRAPSSLIDALEQHLSSLDSKKGALRQSQQNSSSVNKTGGSSDGSPATALAGMLGNLTPQSSRRPSSPGNLVAGASASSKQDDFRDDEVRRALEEEARVLSQLESSRTSSASNKSKQHQNNKAKEDRSSHSPSGTGVATVPKSIDDIFGDPDSFGNNNGFAVTDGPAAMAFDNLSNTSSSSGSVNTKKPDVDTIKSSIKSAATTLQKPETAKPAKKASDELFSLLQDTPAVTDVKITKPSSTITSLSTQASAFNQMSPFGATPFDLPAPLTGGMSSVAPTNGQSQVKPGNPFPDAVGLKPTPVPMMPSNAMSGAASKPAIFQSGTSQANYTNIGVLEGFGDVLQPMSGNSAKTQPTNNNFAVTKSAFATGTGLFKGDLDSTLANLAQNLTFESVNKTKK